MYCSTCQYPLTTLQTPRCPECGREFDPDDSRTYSDRHPATTRIVGSVAGIVLGVLIAIPAFVLATFSAGAACVLFPLPMVATLWTDVAFLMVLLQFPAYGAIVGWCALVSRKVLFRASVIMLLVHVGAVAVCFSCPVPHFS